MKWSRGIAGDPGVLKSAIGARTARLRWVLSTCILVSSLAFVDGSVVNVGLPAIGRGLHGSGAELPWVVNAYLLPLSALLLLGGAGGDRFGRRKVMIVGIALFALGSAACALALNLAELLAARGLQGIGAAFLLPNSLAILGGAFVGETRGRAVGTWAAAGAVAGAIGPVLGGWFIDVLGWRAIFLINLPLALAGIALALAFVQESSGVVQDSPFDLWGALLATGSLTALTWALTVGAGGEGWSPLALAALFAGMLLSGAFLWLERGRGTKAMMPLALFGSLAFVGLTVVTLLLYGALGVLVVLVPYVLIQGAGYSALAAGAVLLPFPLVLALTSRLMGGIAGRAGPRRPLTLGSFVVAAGFLLLLRVGTHAKDESGVLLAMLVIALGMAGVVAPLTTAVLTSVDMRYTGLASGLNSAVARGGGLIGTALLGSVLAARGTALFDAFHMAVIVCALVSCVAGATAFMWVPKK
jgi:EmrB/QacA subfamily drug resistance transporter